MLQHRLAASCGQLRRRSCPIRNVTRAAAIGVASIHPPFLEVAKLPQGSVRGAISGLTAPTATITSTCEATRGFPGLSGTGPRRARRAPRAPGRGGGVGRAQAAAPHTRLTGPPQCIQDTRKHLWEVYIYALVEAVLRTGPSPVSRHCTWGHGDGGDPRYGIPPRARWGHPIPSISSEIYYFSSQSAAPGPMTPVLPPAHLGPHMPAPSPH